MLFFALILTLTLLARLAGWLGLAALRDWAACMRLGLGGALLFAGVDHLANPWRYRPMMPSWVPAHEFVIAFTGLCEIAGAAGLQVARLRRLAGVLLAVYFVCVFPANIKNAVEGLSVTGLPSAAWYYWVRLAFQPLAIWWALTASGVLALPGGFGRSQRAKSA